MAAKMMMIAETVTPTAWAMVLRAGAAPSLATPSLSTAQRRSPTLCRRGPPAARG